MCSCFWPTPTFSPSLFQHIVNSWNEWDQLEEIIVGTASLAVIPPVEPAFEMKVKDSGKLEMLSAANGIFRTFLIFAFFPYCKY
jgi:glycine amidinotransferase